MGSKGGGGVEKSPPGFRQYIPDLNTPRFQTAKDLDCYQYAKNFQDSHNPPWLYNLSQTWQDLLGQPYKGVTTDGLPPSP
jgi:hypothetical protein